MHPVSRRRFIVLLLGTAVGLAGCTRHDPLAAPGAGAGSSTIVVGSQDYYSNEILAEIYAQGLERAGFTVDRQFRIGQREVYLPEIEAGGISLIPEYTGNLLQYWEPQATSGDSAEIYAQLLRHAPSEVSVLEQSSATDQDSYTVTSEFSQKWGVTGVADLARVSGPLRYGAPSEAESRPYGPRGLADAYGVEVDFTPIEDSGGPLTLKALRDNDVQVANIYSADPAVEANGLVTLEDPRGLLLPSHVVPLAHTNLAPAARRVINAISATLTTQDLIDLNARSVQEQQRTERIAREWWESHPEIPLGVD
ncbi:MULTISPECIES: ABC transporter substrate-binding protein [unclassified Corynebacterium]|uniref:ABC transporter substrate-binding protein n=1 Tax=unclassified Corynebacterium TaxID=2624378 RepID=UPI0029CA9E5F|nr:MULTISPECIES: ABC transporter substrate-binding protein [unclassified Corynebacterium]WPF67314.1 ABC transporter substrate-binding protein [Corynebacterium sp. 22KM0430]WPF69805.1 ABC transporter substrate-binding protein [Corynebacterium sp. 21KM1197]